MTDTCTVEIGLLKKHPCGVAAVTKCVNCEQPLCAKHALPKMSDGKKIFLCQECARAWKTIGDIPAAPPATPPAAPAPAAPAAKKPPEPPKPAAAPKPAPAAVKPPPETSGPLEFTPGKAPPPAPAGGKTELSIEQSMPPEPKPDEKK